MAAICDILHKLPVAMTLKHGRNGSEVCNDTILSSYPTFE